MNFVPDAGGLFADRLLDAGELLQPDSFRLTEKEFEG
jgi:hypothetical protein